MRERSKRAALATLLLGGVAVAAAVGFVACKSPRSDEPTCSGAQALSSTFFKGASLKPKTLAFTFDDGPGDRTAELSLYLKEQGIHAAFFVNGMRIDAAAGPILAGMIEDGHLVGNHTETHASLTGTATGTPRPPPDTIVSEIAKTDTKIAPYVSNGRWLFRPPFGDFDDQTLSILEKSSMKKYIGPISWDIGDQMNEADGRAADWDCWQDGTDAKRLTVEQCGDLYLKEIKRQDRGIVLMHDPYFDESSPTLGGTVDMVKYMVPKLKAEGFHFARVDEIPDIADVLPASEDGDGGGASEAGAGPDPAAANDDAEVPPAEGADPCAPAAPATSSHGESGNLRGL